MSRPRRAIALLTAIGLPGCRWNPCDPASGNAWENQGLFNFDGQVPDSMDSFLDFVPAESGQ